MQTINMDRSASYEVQLTKDAKKVMASALMANVSKINGVKYLEIPTSLLVINQPYQRKAKGHERAIAASWDKHKAGVLRVSYRDGVFYVIDGQHRVLAAQIVGEESLTCQIEEKFTLQREALEFGTQTTNARWLSVQERFSAMLIAGREREVAVNDLCKRYNVVADSRNRNDKPVLKGLSTSLRAYDVHGLSCLEFAFDVIKKAGWHMEPGAYSDAMIRALVNIYANHRHDIDHAKTTLAAALERVNYEIIKSRACCAYVGRGNSRAITALFEKCIATEAPIGLIASPKL